MKSALSRDDVVDLLENVLDTEVVESSKVKGDIMFNCTIHGESNPSAGVSVEKGVFNCFSCHARGSISWLVYKSLPDDYKNLAQVDYFLKERYGVDFKKIDRDFSKGIKRYEDFLNIKKEEKVVFTMPLYKIAPYKSGKETYSYFYDRGFTKETLIAFRVGRDLRSKTVTIPVFWEDKKLAGIIGRYIDPNRPKNSRYKIYEFPKGSLLFPLDKFRPTKDNTVILVEGVFDAMWLHQLGFYNTLAILGNGMSKEQAKMIKEKAKKVVDMFDDDKGGRTSTEIARKLLGKEMSYYTVKYPEGKRDPQELTKGDILDMLNNAESVNIRKIKRM